jgi:hypothetical protein
MAEFIKGRAVKKGNFIINSAINLYSSLNGRQITDKEIAGELGITPSTLSKYKNGEIELGQITLLAALLEKIPPDQRMLPFQWAEAFRETVSTAVRTQDINNGVLIYSGQNRLLADCVGQLADKDSVGLIFTASPVAYEKVLALKGKTSRRVSSFDPLHLSDDPREVANRFVENINFLWPDRALRCSRFLENLFVLMAKLNVLNIVGLYQTIYSDGALKKFLGSNAASGQYPEEVKAVRDSWFDPEPNFKEKDQVNLMRILDPMTRGQYPQIDWDLTFEESQFVIFEMDGHNILGALALKSQFTSVAREKTRAGQTPEFTKNIIFACDDYSEIAAPEDVAFLSASRSLKLYPLLVVSNPEKLEKKFQGSEEAKDLLPSFGSLIIYRGCAPAEVVKYVEQHAERRVDFRGVADTDAYIFRREPGSSPSLERRQFFPGDREQILAAKTLAKAGTN